MGGVVQAGVEIGQWDVGNFYKMKGKAGANWGGISSSLRSCHAAHSPKFLSPLLLFSTHPLSFSLSYPGADGGDEENSKRAGKMARRRVSEDVSLFACHVGYHT